MCPPPIPRSELGHEYVDVLKFDIEGHEWPVCDSPPERQREHGVTRTARLQLARASASATCSRGMYMYHSQGRVYKMSLCFTVVRKEVQLCLRS